MSETKILPMKAPSQNLTDEDLKHLNYPLFGSFKLDGLRAMGHDGILKSKTMKPFRNRFLNEVMRHELLTGLDGELTVGSPFGHDVIRRAMSGITRGDGEPDFKLNLFDTYRSPGMFKERHNSLSALVKKLPREIRERCDILSHYLLRSVDDVLKLEEKALAMQAEGLMIRGIESPYVFGRCTFKQAHLLKLKRFEDGEVLVLELKEAMTNTNDAEVKEDGAKRRSTKKEGLVPAGMVGVLVGRDVKSGEVVRVGPGRLTAKEREHFWRHPELIKGKLIRYRHFPFGTDAARFPTYQAIVDPDTL